MSHIDTLAKKNVFLTFGAACTCAIIVFFVLLRASILQPSILDTSQYRLASPADFKYSCKIDLQDGYYTYNGYAFLDDSTIHALGNYIVLYHAGTNTYLRVPTQNIASEESRLASKSQSENYILGGFTAKIKASHLKYTPSEYLICITVHHIYEPIIVATAQNAEVNT